MIKYKPNCKSCTIARQDPKFRKRVYHARYLREDGDETLQQVAADYPELSYVALYNHVKKHVAFRQPSAPAVVINKVEKARAKLQKEIELSVDHEAVVPTQDFEKTWDMVISEGLENLKKRDVKVTVNQLLAATKLKSEYHMKKRGQDTEVIKMMMRAAAGNPEPKKDLPSGA